MSVDEPYHVTMLPDSSHSGSGGTKPAIFTVEAPQPGLQFASHAGHPYRVRLHQHRLPVVRMKSARPALFGLVGCEAGVIKGWLIREVGDPVGPGTPDQRRDRVDDQSKA